VIASNTPIRIALPRCAFRIFLGVVHWAHIAFDVFCCLQRASQLLLEAPKTAAAEHKEKEHKEKEEGDGTEDDEQPQQHGSGTFFLTAVDVRDQSKHCVLGLRVCAADFV
jgi:hypothetical protein